MLYKPIELSMIFTNFYSPTRLHTLYFSSKMSQSNFLAKKPTSPVYYSPSNTTYHFYPNHEPMFDTIEKGNIYERIANDRVLLKPIVSSIAVHDYTMDTLGINAKVYDMFNRASLNVDYIFNQPCYKELIHEFIASLEPIEGDGFAYDYDGWKFRLQNVAFQWSRKDASRYLGFPEGGLCHLATADQALQVWKDMTRLDSFDEETAKPSLIVHPHYKYIHRLIATNINCSPETMDSVTIRDLDIMWALDQGEPINWFDLFTSRFLNMQRAFSFIDYVGCTSLITSIAVSCQFVLPERYYEFRELDFALMKKLDLLAKRPTKYKFSCETDPSEDTHSDEPKDKDTSNTSFSKKPKNCCSTKGWYEVKKVVIKEYTRSSKGPIEMDMD